jgi:hypothetical protein
MRGKLSVALQLEVAHHFVERPAVGRTRRLETPATFGATKTPKTLLFNPYQLPPHRAQILQALIEMVCRESYTDLTIFRLGESLFLIAGLGAGDSPAHSPPPDLGASFKVAESPEC